MRATEESVAMSPVQLKKGTLNPYDTRVGRGFDVATVYSLIKQDAYAAASHEISSQCLQ